MSVSLARLKNPWVLLLFAAGLAALVAYIAYVYLQQREQRIKEEVAARASHGQTPRVAVVVPRQDAPVGTGLDQGLFVARDIEQDLVYPDTIMARDFDSVRGQRLARPVMRGRPLRLTDLQAPEVDDVASLLPAGMRAVTIEIDTVNSIAQTLRPGHRVDLFLMSKADKAKDSEIAEMRLNQATLFMQNLTVLATGQEFQDVAGGDAEKLAKMVRPGEVQGAREKGFDTITVLVTPREAARLIVAQKMGSFRVALRGRKDADTVALRATTGTDVLPPTAGRGEGVEFIVGGKGGGNAALPSSLVPVGLPDRPAGARAATAQADVRAAVVQALGEMVQPRRPDAERAPSTSSDRSAAQH
ncbi:MAG: Flp pilus assembly protein CpaB [Roseateles sp.]|uniref:Flp pilus assembly protein CpaB n=1 Tax=Roseateles sp. TaxID=1971397 RepID=UPI0039EA63B9